MNIFERIKIIEIELEAKKAHVRSIICGESIIYKIQTTGVIGYNLEVKFYIAQFKSLSINEIIERIMKYYERIINENQ